jgi:hypothetical protein
VYFEDQYSVNANSRINILMKMTRYLAPNEHAYCYYGLDGCNYASVENEHMGLFTITNGTGVNGDSYCYNGTSESMGLIPAILYFVD